MSKNPNSKEIIKIIAKALGELNDGAVFVGGATVPFYLPEIYITQARPTEDVDVVMEIVGRQKNSANEKKLREKGFRNDMSEGAPACRWIYRDFKVDIMSSDVSALGFTNQWYQEGIERSIEIESLPVKVNIFSLPYFIATKIDAFKGRGNSDYLGSPDMEDIISVLEVSPVEKFEAMLNQCSSKLQMYLKKEFKSLLRSSDFIDALPGAVFNRANKTAAVQGIKERMQRLLEKK